MTPFNVGVALVIASVALLGVAGRLSLLLVLIPAAAALGYILLRFPRHYRVSSGRSSRLTIRTGARGI
jgi:hypothetical protein